MNTAKISLLSALLLTQCAEKRDFSQDYSLPKGYQLEQHTTLYLPDALEEISGLEWKDNGELWGIEDESSILYQIDPESGKILKKQKFAKNKDIEDLLVYRDTAYVLQSNGDLYEVSAPMTDDFLTRRYDFPIDQKRDFEAIVTLDTEPSLLLFCKVCKWDKNPSRSSVYRFDLVSKTYQTDPYMVLKREDLQAAFPEKDLSQVKMQPAAAAIHPITRELYLMSSTDRWLLVMSQQGDFLEFHQLPASYFKQPEGITFDAKGNLYISNEARDGRPNILLFPYQP